MHLEVLMYPFIFAAIYFEVFLLVTFLSAPARASRARVPGSITPSVAMIVPCYNEEKTIHGTVESLLALHYPKNLLSIILVNDGSTDGTKAVIDTYAGREQIRIIHQENGGKHTALNAGIVAAITSELVGCLDADSFVEQNALMEIVPCFADPNVAAATSAMSVHRPKTALEHMQNAEYILGIALRHILAVVNGLYVTPGPFSLYRRDVTLKLGGFKHGHNTEDMEMALRMQRAGHVIDNAPRARVFTKAPRTVSALLKQRTRWTTGFLRNMFDGYGDMIGNPKYGSLGLMVLPLGVAAVAGGLIVFFSGLIQLTSDALQTLSITQGVPLAYTLTPRFNFEWFYFPASALIIFALIALVGSIAFMIVGQKISETPGKIGSGVIAYMVLYALIAPFWLMLAVADVATGIHRSWR